MYYSGLPLRQARFISINLYRTATAVGYMAV